MSATAFDHPYYWRLPDTLPERGPVLVDCGGSHALIMECDLFHSRTPFTGPFKQVRRWMPLPAIEKDV